MNGIVRLEGLGPYFSDYSRNGRQLLLCGRKGHVATFDWREGKLGCEINLGETARTAKWLHNNQYFAVAQRKHVYVYDQDGVEIHRLGNHREVTRESYYRRANVVLLRSTNQFVSDMEFLPYHFLLATIVWSGISVTRGTLTHIFPGNQCHSQVSGYFNRSACCGDRDQTRAPSGTGSKPAKRHTTCSHTTSSLVIAGRRPSADSIACYRLVTRMEL